MSDISRLLWEVQENTRRIEALTKEVADVRRIAEDCLVGYQDDQVTLAAITRILDRVVDTVDLSQALLETRVSHIEDGYVDSESKLVDNA